MSRSKIAPAPPPTCPICNRPDRVAHVTLFAWHCRRCRAGFTARAYRDGDPWIAAADARRESGRVT